MANKKISQLPSSSLNPSLSGVTTLVVSGTTFQSPLSTLRQTLVDSGSHTFTGSQTILGNLNVSGSLTAQEYIVSSSVVNVVSYNVSGSSNFGNTLDDIHRFTGSVNITGSLLINGLSHNTSSYPISISGTTIYSPLSSSNVNFSTNHSIILGAEAGYNSNNAIHTVFIGYKSGYLGTNTMYSNFIGLESGTHSGNASSSNFIGFRAGSYSDDAHHSNFIGYHAGMLAPSASYSNLIGYNAGFGKINERGIGSNNIIIGTNITLETDRKDSINIGAIIFGTGSYSTIEGNPFSGSANGRIGINQLLPIYSLDVSGSGRFTNGLEVTGSLSIGSVNENLTLNIGGGGSTYTFNYNSGSIFYVSGSVGTNTYNITNIPTTPQRALTLTFVLEQGSTPYSASSYQFNGGAISVKWADSIIPTGSANKTDVIGLTAFRSGSSWNVLGSLTSFG